MGGRLLAAMAALIVSACAAVPSALPPSGPRPARNDIGQFALAGRVAVRNGPDSFSARIEWTHAPDGRDEILITSPLGQGVARLRADRLGASVETAEGQRHEAPDLDALSEQVFGARLPLSQLPRWVVGQVWNAVDGLELDAAGRPLRFADQGWTVAYLDYEDATPQALPTLIRLQHGDLELRLKVDQWGGFS
jgi:outer membrane lipoprotein LolB